MFGTRPNPITAHRRSGTFNATDFLNELAGKDAAEFEKLAVTGNQL